MPLPQGISYHFLILHPASLGASNELQGRHRDQLRQFWVVHVHVQIEASEPRSEPALGKFRKQSRPSDRNLPSWALVGDKLEPIAKDSNRFKMSFIIFIFCENSDGNVFFFRDKCDKCDKCHVMTQQNKVHDPASGHRWYQVMLCLFAIWPRFRSTGRSIQIMSWQVPAKTWTVRSVRDGWSTNHPI